MKLETLHEARYVGGRSKEVFIDKFLELDEEEPEGIQYNIKDEFIMKIQNRHTEKEIAEKIYFYTDGRYVVVDFSDHGQSYRIDQFFDNIEVYETKRVF